jgi:hypothetical protein
MPLEYLRSITCGPLPLQVIQEDRIDKLRVLVAADMVIADLPRPGHTEPAVVRGITRIGRAWLAARSGFTRERLMQH